MAQQCVRSICLDALTPSKHAPNDMSNGLLVDLPPKLDWGISQLLDSPRCHVRRWLHRHMMSQRCSIAFREVDGVTRSHRWFPHSGSADTVALSFTRRDQPGLRSSDKGSHHAIDTVVLQQHPNNKEDKFDWCKQRNKLINYLFQAPVCRFLPPLSSNIQWHIWSTF